MGGAGGRGAGSRLSRSGHRGGGGGDHIGPGGPRKDFGFPLSDKSLWSLFEQ